VAFLILAHKLAAMAKNWDIRNVPRNVPYPRLAQKPLLFRPPMGGRKRKDRNSTRGQFYCVEDEDISIALQHTLGERPLLIGSRTLTLFRL